MSVPDDGYSTNTSFAPHWLSSFLFLFYYERTWWRLFHKYVIRSTLYVFVQCEWRVCGIIFIGYAHSKIKIGRKIANVVRMTCFWKNRHQVRSCTWWRLFHKHVIRTTLAIFVSIFILLWAYLMTVIPQTRHSRHQVRS
jgi:hypothetical protein